MKIVARLYLLTTDEGGRYTPKGPWAWSFDFGVTDEQGQRMLNDCWVDLGGPEFMAPGEELTVTLKPLFPDSVRTSLKPGLEFTTLEGRIIGRGTIIEILEDD